MSKPSTPAPSSAPRERLSLRQRAVRGATWSIFAGNASQLVSIAFFLAISRLVGPAAFGATALSLAIVEISRAVITESLAAILTAKRTCDHADYDAALPLSLAVSVAMALAILAAAPFLAALYHLPELAPVLSALAWLVPIQSAARVQDAWLTRQMRFQSLALRSIASVVIGGIAGLIAAHQGMGAQALVIQQLAMAVSACVIVWAGSGWRPSLRIDRTRLRAQWRAALALTPASFLSSLAAMLDGLAAGLSGATAAGIYGLAKRIRLSLQFGLSSGLTRAALPAFAEADTHDGRLSRVLLETLRVSMLAAFPVFVGVAAVAPELIALVLDHRWIGAEAPVFFLLLAGPITIATTLLESTLLVAERRGVIVGLKCLHVLLLLGALALAARHGLLWIGVATLVATACVNAATFLTARRSCQLPQSRYAAAVSAPLLLSLLMFAGVGLLRLQLQAAGAGPLVRLPLLMGAGAATYFAGAWLLARPALKTTIRAAKALF